MQEFPHAMVQPSTFPFSLNDFLFKFPVIFKIYTSLKRYVESLVTSRPLNNSLPAGKFHSTLVSQVNGVNQTNLFTFRSSLYYKRLPDVPGCSIGKVSIVRTPVNQHLKPNTLLARHV